jgi:hypothetical protein
MSLAELSCCEYIGTEIRKNHRDLSMRWPQRLVALLPVEANDASDIAANTVVTEHARELGWIQRSVSTVPAWDSRSLTSA